MKGTNKDFEKSLFVLQAEFRRTLNKKILGDMFLLLRDYCKILFSFLRIQYDDDVAVDVSENLLINVINGEFIGRSWKSYLILKIKKAVLADLNKSNPLTDDIRKDITDKEKDLLECIWFLLKKYISTFDNCNDMILFLLFLKRKDKFRHIYDSHSDYNCRRMDIVGRLWLYVLHQYLLNRGAKVGNREDQKSIIG